MNNLELCHRKHCQCKNINKIRHMQNYILLTHHKMWRVCTNGRYTNRTLEELLLLQSIHFNVQDHASTSTHTSILLTVRLKQQVLQYYFFKLFCSPQAWWDYFFTYLAIAYFLLQPFVWFLQLSSWLLDTHTSGSVPGIWFCLSFCPQLKISVLADQFFSDFLHKVR